MKNLLFLLCINSALGTHATILLASLAKTSARGTLEPVLLLDLVGLILLLGEYLLELCVIGFLISLHIFAHLLNVFTGGLLAISLGAHPHG